LRYLFANEVILQQSWLQYSKEAGCLPRQEQSHLFSAIGSAYIRFLEQALLGLALLIEAKDRISKNRLK
jgi:hypothetical protein